MAWFVFCKACDLRFSPQNHAVEAPNAENEISLVCPYCGEAKLYSVRDILRAIEATV
ncbi:MAG TPA: hypothetical protein VE998_05100 [Terriglobales bacterium]|nr:hypothetical protein [Terriglobales bacterium]